MVCGVYGSQNIIGFGGCFNFAQYPFYEPTVTQIQVSAEVFTPVMHCYNV